MNLGLVAAQSNGIAACAYSLNIYSKYIYYSTLLDMVCSIKTSFIFLFDKRTQNDPGWGRLLKRPLFSSF